MKIADVHDTPTSKVWKPLKVGGSVDGVDAAGEAVPAVDRRRRTEDGGDQEKIGRIKSGDVRFDHGIDSVGGEVVGLRGERPP